MTHGTRNGNVLFATPAWLQRAYDYVGAHKNTMRYENERDRALQRTAMPLAAVAWILVYHRIVDTGLTDAESAWVCAAAQGPTLGP